MPEQAGQLPTVAQGRNVPEWILGSSPRMTKWSGGVEWRCRAFHFGKRFP